MKIYNKIVLDMETWEVLEEDSFDYDGRVALCKGGGGGGGGSSGKIDYPTYIKVIQASWLGGGSPDGSGMYLMPDGYSLTEVLYQALSNNPYANVDAFDPSDHVDAMNNVATSYADAINNVSNYMNNSADTHIDNAKDEVNNEFNTTVQAIDTKIFGDPNDLDKPGLDKTITDRIEDVRTNALNHVNAVGDSDLESYLDSVIGALNSYISALDSYIDNISQISANVGQFDDYLDGLEADMNTIDVTPNSFSPDVEIPLTTNQLEQKLAEFDAGMQDVNAVMSSTFVIGRHLVAANLLDNMNKGFQAALGEAKVRAKLEWETAKLNASIAEARRKTEAKLQMGKLKTDVGLREEVLRVKTELDFAGMKLQAKLEECKRKVDATNIDVNGRVSAVLGQIKNKLQKASELVSVELGVGGLYNNHKNNIVKEYIGYEMQALTVRRSLLNELIKLKEALHSELLKTYVASYGDYTRIYAEVQRLAIIAFQEMVEKNLEIDEAYASWQIDRYMDAGNVLGAASGGTITKGRKAPSSIQSALASGIAGGGLGYLAANAGLMGSVGGPAGAAIGAAIGIGMSLLS